MPAEAKRGAFFPGKVLLEKLRGITALPTPSCWTASLQSCERNICFKTLRLWHFVTTAWETNRGDVLEGCLPQLAEGRTPEPVIPHRHHHNHHATRWVWPSPVGFGTERQGPTQGKWPLWPASGFVARLLCTLLTMRALSEPP